MIPIITIDGPSGTGKGTIAKRLAQKLRWSLLDSGALYRVAALAALRQRIPLDAAEALVERLRALPFPLKGDQVWLDGENVSQEIRQEAIGTAASQIAALPEVRQALLDWQRQAVQPPGLVADGRDMGTLVFPHALLKIFLTASLEERAKRRLKQLKEKGFDDSLAGILQEIGARDLRDQSRLIAPLRPATDALVIDTTHLDVDEVFLQVYEAAVQRLSEKIHRRP